MITKALIPIAGLGTRLLPLSKVIPKAMLPVYNKPCVQWIVEELVEAGITEICFIYSQGQELLEEYFCQHTWYEDALLAKNKSQEIKLLKSIQELAKFSFIKQEKQLGDGHALLQAKQWVSNAPCIVIFGDCMYQEEKNINRLVSAYKQYKSSLIAVHQVSTEKVHQYGIVSGQNNNNMSDFIIEQMQEKPQQKDALSNLAVIGRYVLSPSIWPFLEQGISDSGEMRLIDALQALQKKEAIRAIKMNGVWLDTGTIDGLWEAGEFIKKNLNKIKNTL